jgi:hypothetical protein
VGLLLWTEHEQRRENGSRIWRGRDSFFLSRGGCSSPYFVGTTLGILIFCSLEKHWIAAGQHLRSHLLYCLFLIHEDSERLNK